MNKYSSEITEFQHDSRKMVTVFNDLSGGGIERKPCKPRIFVFVLKVMLTT